MTEPEPSPNKARLPRALSNYCAPLSQHPLTSALAMADTAAAAAAALLSLQLRRPSRTTETRLQLCGLPLPDCACVPPLNRQPSQSPRRPLVALRPGYGSGAFCCLERDKSAPLQSYLPSCLLVPDRHALLAAIEPAPHVSGLHRSNYRVSFHPAVWPSASRKSLMAHRATVDCTERDHKLTQCI